MQNKPSIDERQASWKVLLPVKPESKLLAIGVDEGILCSLRRSFGCVDTLSSEGRRYDIIVLDCRSINRSNLRVPDSCAGIETVIVCINADRQIKKKLKASGYCYVNHYAGLPAAKPRIYIPLNSSRLRTKGLFFHSPGSLKAKAGLLIARTLSSLGIKSHLMRNVVSIFSASKNISGENSLVGWISGKIGYGISDLVVYAGSESERRKITALAIAEKGGADVVVKIADTQLATEAIRQESDALRVIVKTTLAGYVPKVIFEGFYEKYYIQIQEALSPNGGQIGSLTDRHFEFLSELSKVGRRVCPLEKTSVWQKVKAQIEDFDVDDLPIEVARVADYVLSDKVASMKICCHRIHGDFAPWNIRVKHGKLFVFDWEDSIEDGLPFLDILHFIYRQASLVGPWLSPDKLIDLVKTYSDNLSIKASLSDYDFTTSLTLWMLQEYLMDKSEKTSDMIKKVWNRKICQEN